MTDPHRMIDAYLDGALAPADVDALAAWIKAAPDNAALFTDKAAIHAQLCDLLSEPAAPAAEPSTPSTPDATRDARAPLALLRQREPIPLTTWLAAASFIGVVVLLGILGYLLKAVYDANQGATDEPGPDLTTIAVLFEVSDDADYTFDGPGEHDNNLRSGHGVPPGVVDLKRGTLTFKFNCDAEVTLKAPATFGLNDVKRAFLEHGELTAYCPEKATGFTIGAPGCAVIDLGTRFSMLVDALGVTNVTVTEGRVDVQRENGERVALTRGATARVALDQALRMALTQTQPRFTTSDATSTAGYVYWSFDDVDGGVLADGGRGFEGGPFDVTLPDDVTRPSAVAGVRGRAAAFDGENQFIATRFAGIGGKRARTVAFWVRVPSDATRKEATGMMGWGDPSVDGGAWQVSWNYYKPHTGFGGTFNSLRLYAGGKSVIIGETNLRDGQWHHVAIVLEANAAPTLERDVRLYVDGALERVSRVIPTAIDTRTGFDASPVRIGWSLYGQTINDPNGRPSFRGAIDELYIIDAALDRDQIQELYTQP